MKKLMMTVALIATFVNAIASLHEIKRNVIYREGEPGCNVDVAYVPDAKALPVIVWFHGGGLTGGSKEIPEALLRDSVVVVGVEYRLSPTVTVDEIIDDAAAAVAWTARNIGEYGGDSSKLFIAGHSAGGYLVSMVALDKSRLSKYGLDADQLSGVVPFSGQAITHFEERRCQGINEKTPTIDNLAPLYHVRENCPPMLIISGDRELEMIGRYEEQAYFWRMLKLHGNEDVTLLEMDGFDHCGMCYPGFSLLLEFVRKHTR